jgi:GAF domain-containing protein
LIDQFQRNKAFVDIETLLPYEIVQLLRADRAHSGICLPMMAQENLIGAVMLWTINRDAYWADYIDIAREVADQVAIAIQQARLREETQRRVEELAGLHEIAQAFGALTDVQETFGLLAERLAHLVGAEMCAVFLLDPASNEMQAQAPGYGVGNEALGTFRYSVQAARQIWDFRKQGPYIINSSGEIPILFTTSFKPADLKSMLAVPMWVKGRIIGQITLCNKPAGFKEDDARLLQVFANQAAVVIQNARLYEAEAQRRQEAEALRDTAAALNASLNLDEVLDRILANVERVVPHDAANIMLIEAGVARIVRSRGYAEYGLEEQIQALRLPIASTPDRRYMVETGQPLIVSETQANSNWIITWTRSHVSAPIRLKAEVVGFLNLDSSRPGFFTPIHAERLQAFADQAAVALQNAWFYRQTEQQAKRLQILHGIDQAILAAQPPQVTAQAALRQLRQLVPCEWVSVMLFDFEAERASLFAVEVDSSSPPDLADEISLEAIPMLKELEEGQHVVVENLATTRSRTPLQEQRLVEEGIHSYVNLPLLPQGRLIGLLNLARIEPGPWSAQQLEIAREIGNQLAIAIQQGRLQEQVEHYTQELERRVTDRTRELSALYEITALAGEGLELRPTLERSLELALTAMQAQAGAAHLLDETEERFKLVIHRGLTTDIAAVVERLSPDNHILSWIINHNEPVIVSDLASDPRVVELPRLNLPAYGALVGHPIRTRGQTLGVVSVVRKSGLPPFDREEVALLTSICDHIGIVVESARLRQRAEQAAIAEERARLARDLHDSVTQLLYSVNLFAATGREAVRLGDMAQVNNCLGELAEIAQQALKEMRLLVYELRPPVLKHDGLISALQQRLDIVERRAGVKAELVTDELPDLPEPVEVALYHIIQESLNNVLKHAHATSVTVRIKAEDRRLEVEVADNGLGFDLDAINGRGGLGLVSMRERIGALGGDLAILSKRGEGTRVKVGLELK